VEKGILSQSKADHAAERKADKAVERKKKKNSEEEKERETPLAASLKEKEQEWAHRGRSHQPQAKGPAGHRPRRVIYLEGENKTELCP